MNLPKPKDTYQARCLAAAKEMRLLANRLRDWQMFPDIAGELERKSETIESWLVAWQVPKR